MFPLIIFNVVQMLSIFFSDTNAFFFCGIDWVANGVLKTLFNHALWWS